MQLQRLFSFTDDLAVQLVVPNLETSSPGPSAGQQTQLVLCLVFLKIWLRAQFFAYLILELQLFARGF